MYVQGGNDQFLIQASNYDNNKVGKYFAEYFKNKFEPKKK